MHPNCQNPADYINGSHTHTPNGRCVPNSNSNTTLTPAIHALGQAAFNMQYDAFRDALRLEDDSYARDTYAALKTLARAMAPFTDSTLARLTEAYRG